MATFTNIKPPPYKLALNIPSSRLFSSFMNNLHGRKICKCGAKPIEDEKVRKCFQERNVRELRKITQCNYFKKFQFKDPEECNLADQISEIYRGALNLFEDVIRINPWAAHVYFEALVEIPEANFGDLTGDHGKQIKDFLEKCMQGKLIEPPIDSVFDVGGQNNSTVQLVTEALKTPSVNFIIDINPLTPALSQEKENIKYIVDDAISFFDAQNFEEFKEEYNISHKKNLFIFNNFLNLLTPEKGWQSLTACWLNMNKEDYMLICGLTPEQLAQWPSLKAKPEVEGIITFYADNTFDTSREVFYKSALADSFSNFLENKLQGAHIQKEEKFVFNIKNDRGKIIQISAKRFLIQKK